VVDPVADGATDTEVPKPNRDRGRPAFARHGLPRKRWRRLLARRPSAPDLGRAIRRRYDRTIPLGDAPTLTDDCAPTDSLLLVD